MELDNDANVEKSKHLESVGPTNTDASGDNIGIEDDVLNMIFNLDGNQPVSIDEMSDEEEAAALEEFRDKEPNAEELGDIFGLGSIGDDDDDFDPTVVEERLPEPKVKER